MHEFLIWLATFGADAKEHQENNAKAAASVAFSYALQAKRQKKPMPDDKTPDDETPEVCKTCKGKGYIIQPDGHRTACIDCDAFEQLLCPGGRCKVKK